MFTIVHHYTDVLIGIYLHLFYPCFLVVSELFWEFMEHIHRVLRLSHWLRRVFVCCSSLFVFPFFRSLPHDVY